MSGHPAVAVIVLLGIGGLIVLGAIFLTHRARQKRVERLRTRFGAEYDRMIAEHGDRRGKELLEARERRSLQVTVRPISSESRERFARAWRAAQGQFVDTPGGLVGMISKWHSWTSRAPQWSAPTPW